MIHLIVKIYHYFSVTNPHASTFVPGAVTWIMYPRWWLESIGYWGKPFSTPLGKEPSPVYPNSYPTLPTKEAYDSAYPNGLSGAFYTNTCFTQPNYYSFSNIMSYFITFLIGIGITLTVQHFIPSNKKLYDRIPDTV